MKTSQIPRLFLAILMMTLLALPAAADSPLETLMQQVPASAFEAGQLSYVDYQALVAVRPGAKAPADTRDVTGIQASPEGKAYFQAMLGAASGSTALIGNLMLAEEMETLSGVNPFRVAQSLEAGAPPSQQVWLQGGINREAVAAALSRQDYQASGGDEAWTLWCEDGACENGARTDLSRRDPAFLFGGDLGRRWPVVLGTDRLASSPDAGVIRQIAKHQGPALIDIPEIKAVLAAIAPVPGAERVTQFQLFGPDVLFANSQQAPSAVGLLHLDAPDAQRVVLALHYPLAQSAQDALSRLEAGLDTVKLANGQPLMRLVENQGGSPEPPRRHTADGGGSVLLLAFRFPSQAESAASEPDKASALPFTLFRSMALRRDMDWLIQ